MGNNKFKQFISNSKQFIPSIQFKTGKSPIAGLLVFIVCNDDYSSVMSECDTSYGTSLSKAAKLTEFKGKFGEFLASDGPSASDINKAAIFSIGDRPTIPNQKKLQSIGGKIADLSNKEKISEINIVVHCSSANESDPIYSGILFGIAAKNYHFSKYFAHKAGLHKRYVKEVSFISDEPDSLKELEELCHEKLAIVCNNLIVRDLVNSPPSELNPDFYSNLTKNTISGHGLHTKVLGEKELESHNMNSMLAVGRASAVESKLVIIEYRGNPLSDEYTLALVGKGVCFDSGGLSLKPAGAMEDMKIDMGGSAVVFGTMKLISELKLKVNVVGVMGLVENMVSGDSYKPGDVLTSMSGQTIEVLNTDAEGRLVLADCLYYTQLNYKPSYMLDFATLTGAVSVALSSVHAGIMTDSEEVMHVAQKASDASGESAWRLPLGPEYDKMIDSTVADMKNIGQGAGGGAITAAQFLKRFVNVGDLPKTQWAHLDIAAVAYSGKNGTPTSSKGATGWGVYFTYEFIKNLISKL